MSVGRRNWPANHSDVDLADRRENTNPESFDVGSTRSERETLPPRALDIFDSVRISAQGRFDFPLPQQEMPGTSKRLRRKGIDLFACRKASVQGDDLASDSKRWQIRSRCSDHPGFTTSRKVGLMARAARDPRVCTANNRPRISLCAGQRAPRRVRARWILSASHIVVG